MIAGKKGTPVLGYNPRQYENHDYSPRQKAILEGNIALSQIRTTELVLIEKKAIAKQDYFNLDIVRDLLEAKRSPTNYFPRMTIDEALDILQKLTPWELDYFK